MSVQGFMGLVVLPGKTYTQIVSAPFRLSMAALDEEVKDKKRTTVTVTVDKKEYVLCTLVAEKIEQQPLDITFVEGEEITFAVKGDNIVHLTGNYVFNDDDEEIVSGSEDESDSGEESFDEEEFMKNLPEGVTEAEVRALLAQQGESGDEIESDEELDSDIEEEIEEEEVEPVKTKKRAAEVIKEQPSKKQKAEAKKEEAKKVETKKEEPKKVEAKKVEAKKVEAKKVEAKKEEPKKVEPKKEEPKKKEAKKEEKKVTKLPNGLIIEEVKLGEGASCKSGQRVGMRYIGKLTNGKVFDKNTSGKPFSFLLGRGEVIKGWDIGVAGMKAGGERKLTIPAPLAYGKRGAPPDIPKNATLVFDIRLVSMK